MKRIKSIVANAKVRRAFFIHLHIVIMMDVENLYNYLKSLYNYLKYRT